MNVFLILSKYFLSITMRILLLTLFLLNFNLAFGQNYATLKKTNNSSSADALKRISSTNAYAVDSVGRKNQSEATDSSGMYLHETTTDKIKVFIDCSLCDIKDIKQNVQFVDYVRDRKDADVFVLITTVKNGGGGV